MKTSFEKILKGYEAFRDKYVHGDEAIMQSLSYYGQKPKVMVVACCDSRVDPAVILQCDPGDLFVVRNVANIVPAYEKDDAHHGTSAALEFGIRFLEVPHLILLGHSQCGGIQALLDEMSSTQNDFISNWVSVVRREGFEIGEADLCAQAALHQSYENCLTFPWITERVQAGALLIHRWFFEIEKGEILTYSESQKAYEPLVIAL